MKYADGGNTGPRSKTRTRTPPPSQENTNAWIADVMHNVNDTTIHTMKTQIKNRTAVPHPFQNSDFCMMTACQCKNNCTDHWSLIPEATTTDHHIKTTK